MSHWSAALRRQGACSDAATWCATQKSRRAAWDNCDQPAWLFWICGRLQVDRKQIVLAACACARLALPYVKPGEDRPRICIETTEAWCRGESTLGDVRKAQTAADAAAYAADAAYAAAAYADADAAAYAAAAAADAAAYAADAAARAKMRKACCDEIRRIIPMPELELRRRKPQLPSHRGGKPEGGE